MFEQIGSHLPVLVALAKLTPVKEIFEYGSGFSTCAFFRRHLFPDVVRVTSMENNPAWFDKVKDNVKDDRLVLMLQQDLRIYPPPSADLVLVDNEPWNIRVEILNMLRTNRTPALIVMHDAELECYEAALAAWPFKATFRPVPLMPSSVILSIGEKVYPTLQEIEDALVQLHSEAFP